MKVMRKSIIVAIASFLPFFLTLNAIAKTAAEVFEKASKSVVVVKIQNEKGKDIELGSGVVLPNGDVATNCHVIENAIGITVYQGKKVYNAVPRYIDYGRDVCSLSVPDMKAPAIFIGSTKTLKVGSRVYAIGTPQGLTLTLSEGIISSLRQVEGGQYLQITAPISPGSSGGGLFDEEGRLIGLTTFYIAEGQQLNFAVPVEWIGELSKRHKKELKTSETRVLKEKRIPYQTNLPNINVNKYDDLIIKAANKFKIDSALIRAIIKAESNFNPQAVSPAGAQGLMQLKPAIASALRIKNSFNPEENIEGGARYLRYLLNLYRGNLTVALAAYDAGERAVAKYNYSVPPYRKTQNFVRRVLSLYEAYSSQ